MRTECRRAAEATLFVIKSDDRRGVRGVPMGLERSFGGDGRIIPEGSGQLFVGGGGVGPPLLCALGVRSSQYRYD